MLEEIFKKLAIDNVVAIIKRLANHIQIRIEEGTEHTSYEKYMINSCKRRKFNNIYLTNASIIYTFKDCDTNKDIVSLGIEYIFEGTANDRINYLQLYYNMKEYNTDNISIKAYDCADGVERRVSTSIISENNSEYFGDNGAYWRIPFYNRTPGHMDCILTKVILNWKRFCPIGVEAKLIIDPRNYSKSIKNLTITVKNESKNFYVEYIKLSEYNRRKRKIDKNGIECDIYNIENGSGNYELVKNKELLDNCVNENNIFLMEMKFKKCQ